LPKAVLPEFSVKEVGMTEKELHKIFSANIKRHRIYGNWSQVELAKKTGLSVNFINDLESGKKWGSMATMLKIAHVFNIEVYELLKLPNLFPDNLNSIMRKYTDDAHAALDQICHTLLKEAVNR
jgi:transcriptional regulator with XRE-family HTH domain